VKVSFMFQIDSLVWYPNFIDSS